MPLDAGMWRFDVNTAAAGDFSSYLTPLTMYPTGDVGLGRNLNVAGNIRWGNSVANPDSIELGAPDSSTPGIGTPFIDFHFRNLTQDFNTRIINDADGRLSIEASALNVRGELFLGSHRTSITGFDGAGRDRGYHWIRSDANENEMWMAFAYPFIDEQGRPVAPRRIEGGVPFYGQFKVWSDVRAKTNIQKLGGALNKLECIRGVAFDWAGSPQAPGCVSGQSSIGVIAQEVETVFPELVSGYGNQGHKAVDYSGLTGVLIEAAKELKAQNDE